MIDTIHIAYNFKSRIEMDNCIESLRDRYSLDSTYRETNDNSKKPIEYYSCWDNDFKIWIVFGQVHIQGSLNKLICGNNIELMDNNKITKAYNLLLHYFDFIDWNQGIHKRIDLGVNIELSSSPSLLTNKIIGSKRMRKSTIKSASESVVIGNKSQSIIFYNKTAESKSKEVKGKDIINVPENLLRIEYRIMSSYPMKKYFKTDKVTIPFLLKNLELLPKIWYEIYLSVEKDYSTGIELFSNKKEMEMKALIYFGVESMKSLINESYRSKKMALATKQNLLKYLREVIEYQKSNTSSLDIVKELDSKVAFFIENNCFSKECCVS